MIRYPAEHRMHEAIRVHAPLAGLHLSRQQIQILARACARPAPETPRQRPITVQPAMPVLSTSDRHLIGLVAEGLDNTQLAWRLSVTHAAARNRVSALMRRVGVENRVQLVVRGFELGLLPIAPS